MESRKDQASGVFPRKQTVALLLALILLTGFGCSGVPPAGGKPHNESAIPLTGFSTSNQSEFHMSFLTCSVRAEV